MRVRNIEYWDNKEEHGIKYDWNSIMRTYRQLMRQAGYNDPLYDPSTIPWDNAKYFQLLSERAAGKTTNLILIGMIMNQMYGTQIGYIRQSEDMIKPSIAGDIFNVILSYRAGFYVKWLTDNRYEGIYIHWKKAYFCKYDEMGRPDEIAPEPFLQFLSIDHNFDYKSGFQAPFMDFIVFDEFISGTYRVNEFCDFMDLLSTIIRKRKGPVVCMLSNAINYNSTYFKEFEISREVKKIKVGQHEIITTEKGTNIYVEMIGMKQSAIKTEINRLFYGFKNPRLASITGGEQTWSFDPVPHITHSDTDELITKNIRLDCGDCMLQLELVETEDRGLIINVHEAGPKMYDDTIVLTNGEIRQPNQLWGIGKGPLCKLIWGLYAENKFYYDTNETGSMVANYIKTFRQLRK